MNAMLTFVLTNAVIATAIFVLIAACKSRIRNPAVLHWLWLVVLLKFVTPPFLSPHWVVLPAVVPSAVETPQIDSTEPIVARHTNSEIVSIPQPRDEVEVSHNFNYAQIDRVHSAPAPDSERETTVRNDKPQRAAATRISPLMIIVAVSLGGAILFWGLSIWRIIRLHRFLRFAQEAPPDVQQLTALLAKQLGLRHSPRILLVPGCVSPMLWAFIGPARIVVPNELFHGLDEPSRRTLLLHELVHYSRSDHWVRWLELIVLGLYWWHPIAWLLRREIRISEELACDVRVVSESPGDRRAYAEMLVQTVAFLSPAEVPSLATGIGTGGHLEARLRMIMRSKLEVRSTYRTRALVCLLAILVLPLAPVLVRAQRDTNTSPGTTTKTAAAAASNEKAPEGSEDQSKELLGTVVDEKGKPIADIEVKAFLAGRPVDRVLKTNEMGQFRIPRSWHPDDFLDSHAVLVVRREHSHLGWINLRSLFTNNAQQKLTAIHEPFRMTLLPLSHTVQGTLVDPDGKPLNGIRVGVSWFMHPANQQISDYMARTEDLGTATTDSKGLFVIRMPAGGYGGVQPHHLDWQSTWINMRSESDQLGRTILERGGRIEGRIVDATTGKPLANQSVFAQAQQTVALGYGAATSNADGRYVISGLPPGRFNVLFEGDVISIAGSPEQSSLTAVAVEDVDVLVSQSVQANFLASAGRLLSGKVVESDSGKPLAKVSVSYHGPARPNSASGILEARTKVDGTFTFRVPPGVSKISIQDGDREPDGESSRVVAVPADRDLTDIVLRAGTKRDRSNTRETKTESKKVEGKLEAETERYKLHVKLEALVGRKLNSVSARTVGKGSLISTMWTALSHTGNTVQFHPTEDGRTMFLLVSADGFATARSKEFVVSERMPELTVELVPEVRVPVRGRVVDKSGVPVALAIVRVGHVIHRKEREFPWGREYTTGDDGRFEIKHARMGDQIQVRIDKPGTGGNETEWFSLDRPEPRILPDLVIGVPDQELGGFVRNYEGAPVANAKVMHRGEPRVETTTDAEGKFRLTGLPTGLVLLAIESAGFPRDVRKARTGRLDSEILVSRKIPTDPKDYQVKVTLRPGDGKEVSQLTLHFGVENGNQIFTMPDRTGTSFDFGFAEDARRYSDKQFAIVVAAAGYAWTKPAIVRNQKEPQAINIDLEPAAPATLRGRVIDDDGRPVTDAKVGLSILLNDQTVYEPWRYVSSREKLPVTDADGKFEIAGVLRNSRAAVYINKPGYSGVWSERLAVDKPGDIELPGLRLLRSTRVLSGKVVDDQGHPVADAAIKTNDLARGYTTTDAQGRFRLQNAPIHEFWINAEAENGYWAIKVAPDASEVNLKLKREGEN